MYSFPLSQADERRFFSKVEVGDCWQWTAGQNGGYGSFRYAGRSWLAHRFLFELLVGPVPQGLDLDHLCRNRACVNPDHVEPVSRQVNASRGACGIPSGRLQRSKTHCPRGHEYSAGNTRHRRGARECRSCERIPNRSLGVAA